MYSLKTAMNVISISEDSSSKQSAGEACVSDLQQQVGASLFSSDV